MKLTHVARAGILAATFAIAGCAEMLTSNEPDIVEVAKTTGSFDTLVAAVSAAGLVDTLKGEGSFTVFAPTDEAFAALPASTLDSLLLPENKDQLTAILTYHVLPGRILASDVLGKRISAPTVNGASVHVDGRHGVKVNDANVINADVPASNGVIHVIDKVLLP